MCLNRWTIYHWRPKPGNRGCGSSEGNVSSTLGIFNISPMALHGKKWVENHFCPLNFSNVPGPPFVATAFCYILGALYFIWLRWPNYRKSYIARYSFWRNLSHQNIFKNIFGSNSSVILRICCQNHRGGFDWNPIEPLSLIVFGEMPFSWLPWANSFWSHLLNLSVEQPFAILVMHSFNLFMTCKLHSCHVIFEI